MIHTEMIMEVDRNSETVMITGLSHRLGDPIPGNIQGWVG